MNIRVKTLSPTGFPGLLAAVPRVGIQWVSHILGVILSNSAHSVVQAVFYHAAYILLDLAIYCQC